MIKSRETKCIQLGISLFTETFVEHVSIVMLVAIIEKVNIGFREVLMLRIKGETWQK